MDIDVKRVIETQGDIQIFIDFDNVSWKKLNGIGALPDTTIASFYINSANPGRIQSREYSELLSRYNGRHKEYVVSAGKNSVDFRIIYDAMECVLNGNGKYIYIVSGDQGYDGAIEAIQNNYKDQFLAIKRCDNMNEVISDYNAMQITKCEDIKPFLDEIYGSYRSGFILQRMKELYAYEETKE